MKLLIATCLVVLVAIAQCERCHNKDPLTCSIVCGPNQVHACVNERCACTAGSSCLSVSDCNQNCHHEQALHCIDGECHCLKIDEIDNNN